MRPAIPHNRYKCEMIRFTVTELMQRNRASVTYAEFFRTPCRKNYALDRKIVGTFLIGTTSSITMRKFEPLVYIML